MQVSIVPRRYPGPTRRGRLILGPEKKTDAEYLDDCRKKRNILEYKYVGGASESDAKELLLFVRKFMQEVIRLLKETHPSLL